MKITPAAIAPNGVLVDLLEAALREAVDELEGADIVPDDTDEDNNEPFLGIDPSQCLL